MRTAPQAFLLVLAATLAACTPSEPQTVLQESPAVSMVITEISDGTGAVAAPGQTAVVHYTGWLYSAGGAEGKGAKFDSSHDRAQPFEFELGAGQVITGWDEGVVGMKVGGHRRLVIPPEKGYGARGAGGVIPPGATLVFDVELVGIR